MDENDSAADRVERDAAQLDGERSHDIVFLYQTAEQVGLNDLEISREGDKLLITGRARYELERDRFWDAVKELAGWESEVVVDIDVERTDIRGYHTIEPGETLASIAERYLGSASRELDIFEINRDRMNDPQQISPGQLLLIPW